MELNAQSIARLIDISAVQAPHGKEEIEELVKYAKEYKFIAVHVLPCWVSFLKKMITSKDDIMIGSPVGFPSGGHKTDIKVAEVKQILADGVQEIDMMMNIGKLRSRCYEYVADDIRRVVDAAGEVSIKVIIETYYLSDDDIKKACDVCIKSGAEFVKTSSGWTPEGATLENIQLITSFVGDAIKVKAAGGVRDLDTLVKMYSMGVSRFGINVQASMKIIQECQNLPDSVIRL